MRGDLILRFWGRSPEVSAQAGSVPIYLAAWGRRCRTQGLHCIIRHLPLWYVDSLVASHGLSSCSVQA